VFAVQIPLDMKKDGLNAFTILLDGRRLLCGAAHVIKHIRNRPIPPARFCAFCGCLQRVDD